eukprot:1177531-Amphidinium_carterae.1
MSLFEESSPGRVASKKTLNLICSYCCVGIEFLARHAVSGKRPLQTDKPDATVTVQSMLLTSEREHLGCTVMQKSTLDGKTYRDAVFGTSHLDRTSVSDKDRIESTIDAQNVTRIEKQ